MTRLGVALMAATLATSLLVTSSAHAEDVTKNEVEPGTRPIIGLQVVGTRGLFANIPVSRLGVMGELRARQAPISASLLIEGGNTDNGLGAHRIELAFDLRTTARFVSLSGGVHASYAMLVRATGGDRFLRALTEGDIGSFGVGAHAALECKLPITTSAAFVFGVRGMFETYDGAVGAMIGPQVGFTH